MTSITNQYASDAGIYAKTDWVFSMPHVATTWLLTTTQLLLQLTQQLELVLLSTVTSLTSVRLAT